MYFPAHTEVEYTWNAPERVCQRGDKKRPNWECLVTSKTPTHHLLSETSPPKYPSSPNDAQRKTRLSSPTSFLQLSVCLSTCSFHSWNTFPQFRHPSLTADYHPTLSWWEVVVQSTDLGLNLTSTTALLGDASCSVPHFLHLPNRDNKSSCFRGFSGRLNELTDAKWLQWSLAHNRWVLSDSCHPFCYFIHSWTACLPYKLNWGTSFHSSECSTWCMAKTHAVCAEGVVFWLSLRTTLSSLCLGSKPVCKSCNNPASKHVSFLLVSPTLIVWALTFPFFSQFSFLLHPFTLLSE